jgi:nitrite reductase/ring-hydroxylating ferredoxin subunit
MPTLETHFVRVAHAADVPRGGTLELTVAGRNVLLCHTRDGWFATDNICTHAYAKLSEGRLRNSRLICPLHGGAFDCRTGAALGPPAVAPLATYAIRIRGEDVEVAVSEHGGGS